MARCVGHEGHLWERQEQRLALGHDWWAFAGGRPGWRIADVGCGAGRFSVLFADLTGPTGHVHAVDQDGDLVASLQRRLDPVHHAHVTTEALDVEAHGLPPLRFDLLVLTDVAHHMPRLRDALANLRRADAPLVVAEFDPDGPGELGPPREDRIAPAEMEAHLRATGWTPVVTKRQAFEHYAILARPA